MKVVHLCLSCFFIDGYSYQENILPKYHVKMGFDVTVVASLVSYDKSGHYCQLEEAKTYDDPNGYKVIRLNYKHNNRVSKIFRLYQGLDMVLENEAPDIIFLHDISFMDIDKVVNYVESHPNVMVWADGHTDYYNSATNFLSKNILHRIFWKKCAQSVLPYVNKFWGTTPWRCIFMNEMYGIPNEKLSFLPMGVDDEAIPVDRNDVRNKIRSERGIQEDDVLIFTGGKINEEKNIHVLLSAVKELANPNVKIIVCGVVAPEMKETMERLITQNVIMMGWCNSRQVIDCMLASDIVCLPGTHSTLWEQSVGMGLPGIFKRWDFMTHVDVCGNAILLDTISTDTIKESIQQISDSSQLAKLKENARTASKSFLYSHIAKQALGL